MTFEKKFRVENTFRVGIFEIFHFQKHAPNMDIVRVKKFQNSNIIDSDAHTHRHSSHSPLVLSLFSVIGEERSSFKHCFRRQRSLCLSTSISPFVGRCWLLVGSFVDEQWTLLHTAAAIQHSFLHSWINDWFISTHLQPPTHIASSIDSTCSPSLWWSSRTHQPINHRPHHTHRRRDLSKAVISIWCRVRVLSTLPTSPSSSSNSSSNYSMEWCSPT